MDTFFEIFMSSHQFKWESMYVYPKTFDDINSLNVDTIYTDHMIVFILFVTKMCFGNI